MVPRPGGECTPDFFFNLLPCPYSWNRDRDNVWVDCTECNFAKQYQVSGCTEGRDAVCKDLTECDPRLVNCIYTSCVESGWSPLHRLAAGLYKQLKHALQVRVRAAPERRQERPRVCSQDPVQLDDPEGHVREGCGSGLCQIQQERNRLGLCQLLDLPGWALQVVPRKRHPRRSL